jgi:hypothetical protein
MKQFTLIAVFIALIGYGCEKSETPAYLHIESIDLAVEPNFLQGTADHGIADAHLYLNDGLIGIYELPATVPIISQGNQKITVIAGIINNGIRSARVDYPFYRQYTAQLDLTPGETIDFSGDTENTTLINGYHCPQVTYFDQLVFWHERFEEPGVQFEATAASNASMSITLDPSKVFNYYPQNDSKGSGIVTLTSSNPYFEVKSSHTFNPVKGRKVYLEMNYFSPCTLQVGVYEEFPNVVKVYGKGIMPVNQWSKIYIELTQEIAQRINANNYSIFIEGILSSGQTQEEVLLDNIKLIYPE